MSNSVRFRPLISTRTGVYCHLLEFGKTRIVVNCGITPQLDTACYDSVMDTIKGADAILITSFSLAHSGALFLFPDVPSFSSIPTAVLGNLILEEVSRSVQTLEKDKLKFSAQQIKFSQPFKVRDLTICAYGAGYSLGNSIFKITLDTQSILVGYDINHKRENYLDGATLETVQDASILFTNSAYCLANACTNKVRDSVLVNLVRECSGTVIISVGFTRLIEIVCALAGEKIVLVSGASKRFMGKVSTMVEWAGSRALDMLNSMNIEYCRVDSLKKFKIVIVVDEGDDMSYIGTVLATYNQEVNLFVAIDREVTSDSFTKMKVCKYSYEMRPKRKREKPVVKPESVEQIEYEEPTEHWTAYKQTIFVNGFDRSNLFPYIKRKRHNNDYGEPVKFNFKKNEQKQIKDQVEEEIEEVEHVELVETGLEPKFMYRSLPFYGRSDLESIKTVISANEIQNVCVVDDSEELSKFFCAELALSNKLSAHYCEKEVVIDSLPSIARAAITPEISSLDFVEVFGSRISKANVCIKDGSINYMGGYEPITIGKVTTLQLKRAFLEKHLRVEVKGSEIIVNDKIRVGIEENGLKLSGDDDECLFAVREVIYEYITLI